MARRNKTKPGKKQTGLWDSLPFWLQWGTFGGIFSVILVILIYVGMSFNYLQITKTLLPQGAFASFVALTTGFLHAAIFSVIIHKTGITQKKPIKRSLSFSEEEAKRKSSELITRLGGM